MQAQLQWKVHELLLFMVAVPFILTVIYLLPQELKDAYLILHTNAPTVTNVFLSNYTHSDWGHFSTNVVVYLLVMALVLLLETDKDTFYRVMTFLFIVLPFIASGVTLLFVPVQNSQGVSAIVAGVMGYFVYVVYGYVKNSLKVNVDGLPFILMVFSINAVLSVLYGFPGDVVLVLLFGGVAAIMVYANRVTLALLFAKMRHFFQSKSVYGKFEGVSVIILTIILLFSLPLLVKMGVGVSENGEIFVANAVAHYAGYVCGFFLPMFLKGN